MHLALALLLTSGVCADRPASLTGPQIPLSTMGSPLSAPCSPFLAVLGARGSPQGLWLDPCSRCPGAQAWASGVPITPRTASSCGQVAGVHLSAPAQGSLAASSGVRVVEGPTSSPDSKCGNQERLRAGVTLGFPEALGLRMGSLWPHIPLLLSPLPLKRHDVHE